MNKILSLITLVAFMAQAFGASTTTIEATNTEGFFSSVNLVRDAGFEGQNKGAAWVASGGSLATTSTTPARGSYLGTWDASANAQTLKSKSTTIPAGLYGRNGVVSCLFKAASGTAAHTLTAFDGTNDLATATTISSSTSQFVRTSVNFIFPSSGSIQLKLTSTQDEVLLNIDDCYLGPADGFNLGSVSQATFVGSAYFATTGSCTWTRTGTSIGSFTTTAACPGPTVESNPGPGVIQTTDTDLPKVTVNSLPPGYYKVTFQGDAQASSTNLMSLAISDGTTTSKGTGFGAATSPYIPFNVVAYFNYTTTANQTFELQASASASTLTIDNVSTNWVTKFSIERFPTTSETVYRAENLNYNDTSVTLTPSAGFGTTSLQSTFVSREGNRATFRGYLKLGTAAASAASFALPSGFTIDTAKLTSATSVQMVGHFQRIETGAGGALAVGEQGPIFYDGSDATSVYLAIASGSNSLTKGNGSTIFSASDGVTYYFTVPISGWVQTVNTPVFVGSVTSGATGAERFEAAGFGGSSSYAACTTGACTLIGSYTGWLTSISQAGSGIYNVVIPAGQFSSPPICGCTTNTVTATPLTCTINTVPTTTAFQMVLLTAAGAATNGAAQIWCKGAR